MNRMHAVHQTFTRSLAFVSAASLFAGCAGASHMLPAAPVPDAGAPAAIGAASSLNEPSGKPISVRMEIRIPRRGREHARTVHPATISPFTQSLSIAVNGKNRQVFNTTATSPGCSIGVNGTTCTFAMLVKPGTDTFVVNTYAATGGTGAVLDRGIATVPITKGKVNTVAVRLGPAVTTTADSGPGSLRYAIGSANSGDTILFFLPAGSTITLASPITILGNVSLAGPGTATPITISGGNAHQLFLIEGTATISGLTLTQGRAAVPTSPGGAIFNLGALTLANDRIGGNTSTVSVVRAHHPRSAGIRRHPHCTTTLAEGGAIYNDGALVMTGTTFTGNFVLSNVASCIEGEGGAIYNDAPGSISSTGDTFSSNSTMSGGAVYNVGLGQVSFTSDTFNANTGCTATSGCPTSGCTSTGCTSFAQGEGAAIFDDGAGVTITSSIFTNNVAGGVSNGSTGEGGALALASGIPSVTGSVFSGNLAGGGSAGCSTGTGGALVATVPIVLNNDSFTNNRAVGDGMSIGGAIVATQAIQASGDAFKSNAAVGSGSACSATSEGIGGALYAAASATLTSDTFANNLASGNATAGGGAVVCIDCNLSGDTFTSNAAVGTGAASATSVSAIGGALFGQTLIKMIGSTFTSNSTTIEGTNSAEAFGGAVALSSGIITSSGNVFTSNSSRESVGTGIAAGGAMVSLSGAVVSTHDVFQSNSVVNVGSVAGGGAAFVDGTFVISNATVSGNSARGGTQGIGGGFALETAGELLKDTFTGNGATATAGLGGGGGIYEQAGGLVLNSTLTGNAASALGGGIASAGSGTIIGSTINGNAVTAAAVAHEGGGGLFSTTASDISQSTFANNSVTVSGAGSSGGGGIMSVGNLTLDDSTVSGNAVLGSAASSGGGGIYDANASSFQNDTISNNTSKLDGGGIDVAASVSITLQNVTLFKNTAIGSGGNILNPFTMSLTNSIVAGGTAASGADIKNTGTINSGDYNIIGTAVVGNLLTGTLTHNKTADPFLLALSNNGGLTFTNADQTTSPGRAYIPYVAGNCGSVTLPQDQRGYTRGTGGRCDVGAFEFGGVPSAARHQTRPHHAAAGSHFELDLRPIRLHAIHLAPLSGLGGLLKPG